MARTFRSPYTWPLPVVIIGGIAFENTRWGAEAETVGGMVALIYLCIAGYIGAKHIKDRFR